MATLPDTAPKRRRREETRRKLMDSACGIFARQGYERATVDEIVREAGFSKGAFYVHFESKEDLFWQMLEDRIAAQQETVRLAIDLDASVAENERRILEAAFAVEKQEPFWPALFMEFAAHAGRNEKVRERLTALYERWHGFTAEMLRAGQKGGRIRSDLDIEFATSVLLAIMEGTIVQSRLAPKHLRLNQRIDQLSQLIASWIES
jgi:AcrR family transcriptional regulator